MEKKECKFIVHKNKILYDKVQYKDICYETNSNYGFCVVSEEDNNVLDFTPSTTHFGQNASKISYSINNHTWTNLSGVTTYSLNKGEKLYFKSTSSIHKTSASELPLFNSNKTFSIKGDLKTLVTSIPNYGLYAFFKGTKIKTCNLLMNYNSIGSYGQAYMFHNCTNLITANFNKTSSPLLIEMNSLGSYALSSMFEGCSKLSNKGLDTNFFYSVDGKTIPEYCCYRMYYNCSSLQILPVLFSMDTSTKISSYTYSYMFYNCESLTSASGTEYFLHSSQTVGNHGYSHMFENCTSWTPGSTITLPQPQNSYCYSNMFRGCTSLTDVRNTIKIEKDTQFAQYSCEYMFYGCSNLTHGAQIRANNLADRACQYMFANCPKLKYIYCSAVPGKWLAGGTLIPDRNNGTYHWIYPGVASSGDYYYPNNMNLMFTGLSDPYAQWPSGWTAHAVTNGS